MGKQSDIWIVALIFRWDLNDIILCKVQCSPSDGHRCRVYELGCRGLYRPDPTGGPVLGASSATSQRLSLRLSWASFRSTPFLALDPIDQRHAFNPLVRGYPVSLSHANHLLATHCLTNHLRQPLSANHTRLPPWCVPILSHVNRLLANHRLTYHLRYPTTLGQSHALSP